MLLFMAGVGAAWALVPQVEVWCTGNNVPGAWLEAKVKKARGRRYDVGKVLAGGTLWVEREQVRLACKRSAEVHSRSLVGFSTRSLFPKPRRLASTLAAYSYASAHAAAAGHSHGSGNGPGGGGGDSSPGVRRSGWPSPRLGPRGGHPAAALALPPLLLAAGAQNGRPPRSPGSGGSVGSRDGRREERRPRAQSWSSGSGLFCSAPPSPIRSAQPAATPNLGLGPRTGLGFGGGGGGGVTGGVGVSYGGGGRAGARRSGPQDSSSDDDTAGARDDLSLPPPAAPGLGAAMRSLRAAERASRAQAGRRSGCLGSGETTSEGDNDGGVGVGGMGFYSGHRSQAAAAEEAEEEEELARTLGHCLRSSSGSSSERRPPRSPATAAEATAGEDEDGAEEALPRCWPTPHAAGRSAVAEHEDGPAVAASANQRCAQRAAMAAAAREAEAAAAEAAAAEAAAADAATDAATDAAVGPSPRRRSSVREALRRFVWASPKKATRGSI
jgi:hypothetical protein